MLRVQVISRELIKPSSPTPLHLRSYKLTLLDQSLPSMYVPLLFFYSISDSNGSVEKSQQLKISLSEILTRYFPLAGRIKEGSSVVDCNDQGVEFSEARIGGRVSEFLKQPHIEVLDRMVPCGHLRARSGTDALVAVQVNVFDCGGMAIGVSIHHKIADGASMGTFINGWAKASSSSSSHSISEATVLDFKSDSKRPFPTEGPVPLFDYIRKDNVVAKRFVFDASKIASLRARSSLKSQEGCPTRVEAVSALIWRSIMRMHGEDGSMRAFFASHFVNLRGRMSPPLPEHSFGNIIVIAPAVATQMECHVDMQHCLERKLRAAIRGVDSDCIKELQKPDGIFRAQESLKSQVGKYMGSGVDFIYFTSWCGFPFYDADFGWGRPAWVSTCTVSIKNLVVFTRTSGGDGIEAWVNMEDVDMAKFEQDKELLCFVSPPSPA